MIICTLYPGHLDTNFNQSLAPERGQEKGDYYKNNNFKTKISQKNKKSLNIKLNRNSSAQLIWVGAFVALLFSFGLIINPEKASAATTDRSWNNTDTFKKVIANVSPVIENSTPDLDTTTAPLAFSSDEFMQKPLITETQITPQDSRKKVTKKSYQSSARSYDTISFDGYANHFFPYGYCTYYVSTRRNVTWSGNAITWLGNARAQGYPTGNTATVGAIMVTSEGGYTGHVAYVEGVDGDNVTISEMNYKGWGVISSRTISASSGFIRGYIY